MVGVGIKQLRTIWLYQTKVLAVLLATADHQVRVSQKVVANVASQPFENHINECLIRFSLLTSVEGTPPQEE